MSLTPRRARLSARPPLLAIAAVLLTGCVNPPPLSPPEPLAPTGPVGLVLCPKMVTPVELDSDTPEPSISLGIHGSPVGGDDAAVATPNGRWGFVVTGEGPASATKVGGKPAAHQPVVHNVVVPIDLMTQTADRPIPIPGSGDTRGIAISPDGSTVFVSSGDLVVAIDASSRKVSRKLLPLTVPISGAIQGLAVSPSGGNLYALGSTDVYPISLTSWAVQASIATNVTSASIDSPHGIAVSTNGSTIYVLGTGPDGGGQMARISALDGSLLPPVDFVKYGETLPTAVAVDPNGQYVFVSDLANAWVLPIQTGSNVSEPPLAFPQNGGVAGGPAPAQQHATDIGVTPTGLAAYVVIGFDALLPLATLLQTYETPIPVCQGATSLAIADVP